MPKKKERIIWYAVAVVLFALAIVAGLRPVKAEQPKAIKLVLQSDGMSIYCETPSGDKIYTFAPRGGGAAIWVDKDGCK